MIDFTIQGAIEILLEDALEAFGHFRKEAEKTGEFTKPLAEAMTHFGGAVLESIGPWALLGAAVYKTSKIVMGVVEEVEALGEALQMANKQYIADTGASIEQADKFTEAVAKINETSIIGIPKIGQAMTQLQRRTGLVGEELEKTTQQVVNFAQATGVDAVNAGELLVNMFHVWNIEGENQYETMQKLTKIHRETGVNVLELTQLMTDSANSVKVLGYSWEQAAAMMAHFNKVGLGAGVMSRAMTQFVEQTTTSASGNVRAALERAGYKGKTKEETDALYTLQGAPKNVAAAFAAETKYIGSDLPKGLSEAEKTNFAIQKQNDTSMLFSARLGPQLQLAFKGLGDEVQHIVEGLKDVRGNIEEATTALNEQLDKKWTLIIKKHFDPAESQMGQFWMHIKTTGMTAIDAWLTELEKFYNKWKDVVGLPAFRQAESAYVDASTRGGLVGAAQAAGDKMRGEKPQPTAGDTMLDVDLSRMGRGRNPLVVGAPGQTISDLHHNELRDEIQDLMTIKDRALPGQRRAIQRQIQKKLDDYRQQSHSKAVAEYGDAHSQIVPQTGGLEHLFTGKGDEVVGSGLDNLFNNDQDWKGGPEAKAVGGGGGTSWDEKPRAPGTPPDLRAIDLQDKELPSDTGPHALGTIALSQAREQLDQSKAQLAISIQQQTIDRGQALEAQKNIALRTKALYSMNLIPNQLKIAQEDAEVVASTVRNNERLVQVMGQRLAISKTLHIEHEKTGGMTDAQGRFVATPDRDVKAKGGMQADIAEAEATLPLLKREAREDEEAQIAIMQGKVLEITEGLHSKVLGMVAGEKAAKLDALEIELRGIAADVGKTVEYYQYEAAKRLEIQNQTYKQELQIANSIREMRGQTWAVQKANIEQQYFDEVQSTNNTLLAEMHKNEALKKMAADQLDQHRRYAIQNAQILGDTQRAFEHNLELEERQMKLENASDEAIKRHHELALLQRNQEVQDKQNALLGQMYADQGQSSMQMILGLQSRLTQLQSDGIPPQQQTLWLLGEQKKILEAITQEREKQKKQDAFDSGAPKPMTIQEAFGDKEGKGGSAGWGGINSASPRGIFAAGGQDMMQDTLGMGPPLGASDVEDAIKQAARNAGIPYTPGLTLDRITAMAKVNQTNLSMQRRNAKVALGQFDTVAQYDKEDKEAADQAEKNAPPMSVKAATVAELKGVIDITVHMDESWAGKASTTVAGNFTPAAVVARQQKP